MKKLTSLLLLCSFTAEIFAQAYTPQQAQADGKSFSTSSSVNQFKNAGDLVQNGTGSVDEFSSEAPENLTSQKGKGSLFTIGNESRLGSVSKVNNQGSYSNNRDSQADEAVHFLDKKPVLKPSFAPNDPMMNPDTYSLGASVFESSTQKECKQVIEKQPDEIIEEHCIQTYSPYIYTCQTGTKVSFAKQNYCPPGQKLERVTRNICSYCVDPWIVLDVFCGQTEGTYEVSSWTSSCSSGDCLYGRLFASRVVSASVGSTQDIYLGNFGRGCNFPLYYQQTCNSINCNTAYSLRNSTCPGRDFSAPGSYAIPWREVMSESPFNECTSAEQLRK